MGNSLRFLAGGFFILMPLAFALALVVTSRMRMVRFFKISYFMPSCSRRQRCVDLGLHPQSKLGRGQSVARVDGASTLTRDWLSTPGITCGVSCS